MTGLRVKIVPVLAYTKKDICREKKIKMYWILSKHYLNKDCTFVARGFFCRRKMQMPLCAVIVYDVKQSAKYSRLCYGKGTAKLSCVSRF